MLCILRHRGLQLTLAYIWAMPAVFAAGKGRRGYFKKGTNTRVEFHPLKVSPFPLDHYVNFDLIK